MPKRKPLPSNTDVYEYRNENPKGKKTGDCVFRAISTALGQSWQETMNDLFQLSMKYCYAMNDAVLYNRYLKNKGFEKQPAPRKPDGSKMTGAEFAKVFSGVCVAHIGAHHMTCFAGGKNIDTWNCTDRCVGNYWCKPEDKQRGENGDL